MTVVSSQNTYGSRSSARTTPSMAPAKATQWPANVPKPASSSGKSAQGPDQPGRPGSSREMRKALRERMATRLRVLKQEMTADMEAGRVDPRVDPDTCGAVVGPVPERVAPLRRGAPRLGSAHRRGPPVMHVCGHIGASV